MSRIFMIVLFSFSLLSCATEDLTPAGDPEEGPVITISSPAENSRYENGQAITVSANISDNIEVQPVRFQVKNLTGGNILYTSPEAHPHQKDFSFSASYKVSETTQVVYRITVTAADNDGNVAQKYVDVAIN